ncbi:MAG: cupin domain-containing protein [Candidatus Cloacimonetes bacterium]|nr:cupin domain-containing protein [Candidatus Cloacimonadota bacterium]
MIIKNYHNLPQAANPHGIQSYKLHDSVHAQIMHLLLLPGEELKPHITPVDVTFYVLEGSPTILVGEEKLQATVDDLVESPRDIVHCIYNNSETIARVLVIKTPKPVSATKFVNNS